MWTKEYEIPRPSLLLDSSTQYERQHSSPAAIMGNPHARGFPFGFEREATSLLPGVCRRARSALRGVRACCE